MIILRQKEYSSVGQKVIYGITRVKEPINRTSSNLSNKLYRAIVPNNSKKARELDFYLAHPKEKPSRYQLMKNSINSKNNIKRNIGNTLNKAEKAYLTPGEVINSGVEVFVKNPVSVASQAAGKITMVTDPTGLGVVPIGAGGTALEQVIKKSVPKYRKLTEKAGEKYKNSKLSRNIRNIPSGPEILNDVERLSHSIGL